MLFLNPLSQHKETYALRITTELREVTDLSWNKLHAYISWCLAIIFESISLGLMQVKPKTFKHQSKLEKLF